MEDLSPLSACDDMFLPSCFVTGGGNGNSGESSVVTVMKMRLSRRICLLMCNSLGSSDQQQQHLIMGRVVPKKMVLVSSLDRRLIMSFFLGNFAP